MVVCPRTARPARRRLVIRFREAHGLTDDILPARRHSVTRSSLAGLEFSRTVLDLEDKKNRGLGVENAGLEICYTELA